MTFFSSSSSMNLKNSNLSVREELHALKLRDKKQRSKKIVKISFDMEYLLLMEVTIPRNFSTMVSLNEVRLISLISNYYS